MVVSVIPELSTMVEGREKSESRATCTMYDVAPGYGLQLSLGVIGWSTAWFGMPESDGGGRMTPKLASWIAPPVIVSVTGLLKPE